MPSLLSIVIPSATVLLLVGASCTALYLADLTPKTGVALGVTMLAAAIATAVVGSSQDAVGLSTTMVLLVLLDQLLLIAAAYFTAAYFHEELSTPVGACLAVTMIVASISVMALGFRENDRERAEARVAALDSYLWALASGDLQAAYRVLCSENQEREPLQAFVERQQAGPRILDYQIRDEPRRHVRRMVLLTPPISHGPEPLEVNVRFADGTSRDQSYSVPKPNRLSTACVLDDSEVPTEDGS